MATSDDVAASYLSRLDAFRRSDQDRDEMVRELIKKCTELADRYEKKNAQFESELETRLMWQKASKAHEQELTQLKTANESNSFVYAIIDGDGAYFRDELVSRGEDGGAQAAHQLAADIKNHLKKQYPAANVDDWRIIVQVVLGLNGLNNKLRNCGIIKDPAITMASFNIGFGLSQPLFSVVDVGYGKERADHKIKEMTRAMLRLSQCRHFFFGPCNDNGYLNFLEEYKRDDLVAPKFTLIETQPALPGFIKLGFPRVTFPNVFRSEPLPENISRPFGGSTVAAAAAPPRISSPPVDANGAGRWATVAGTGASGSIDIAPVTKKAPEKRYFLRNADGDRVDERLPQYDPVAEQTFDAKRRRNDRNFCNFYHINGFCVNGERCKHQHGEFLRREEQLVLRHKSRGNRCHNLERCWKVDCVNGHHCKNIYDGKTCFKKDCQFADTHTMDVTPTWKVYEDGSEEVLA